MDRAFVVLGRTWARLKETLLIFFFPSVVHNFDSYFFIRIWEDSLVTIFSFTYESVIAMAVGDNEARAFRVSEKVAVG